MYTLRKMHVEHCCTQSHPKITSVPDFQLSEKRNQSGLFGEQRNRAADVCPDPQKLSRSPTAFHQGGVVLFTESCRCHSFHHCPTQTFLWRLKQDDFYRLFKNVFFVYIIHAHINKDMGKKKIIDDQ